MSFRIPFYLVAISLLVSCAESGEGPEMSQMQDTVSVGVSTLIDKQEVALDYAKLEQYYSTDSVFSFVAPEGFFYLNGNKIMAKDLDFEIDFKVVSQYYPCDPDEEILSLKSLFDVSSKDMEVTYKSIKTDNFVVSGYDIRGHVIYKKCLYSEFFSMQGRDEGAPSHVWSKAGIVCFGYPKGKKDTFNRLVEIIVNSLRVNHDEI